MTCDQRQTWIDAFGKEHSRDCDACTIREALARPDYSHASSRRYGILLYRRDSTSPSGCMLITGVADTQENRSLLKGRVSHGPTRGDIAVGAVRI